MSSVLSYRNLTICSFIWAACSQIEPAVGSELRPVLISLTIAVVVACLIFTALVLSSRETKKEATLVQLATTATLGISELEILPAEAKPGETVTISFKATNISDAPSYYSIILKINGKALAAEVVNLPRRATVPMSFTAVGTLPGDYKVEVNDSTGKFIIPGGNV